MSRQQQEQVGLQAAEQVYTQMPVLPDTSPETKYVQALGERLVATIPAETSWPFQFHVVAQKEINAFALPGGPMFVNIGTITAAKTEAELAGVMGHEMSHVYMQHSAKQQQKSSLLEGIAGLAGAAAGQMGGNWGSMAATGINFGAGTLLLKYSRGDEAQADSVGAIILWKAGFNPVALADFFETLEAEGSSGPQFLSDHPNPGNRRAAIEKEIREWPDQQYAGDSPEFATVREHAAGVHAYSAQEIADGAKSGQWASENRKNGAVFPGAASAAKPQAALTTAARSAPTAPTSSSVPAASLSQVQPSASFATADLGLLQIDRPENWDVRGGQNSSVTIAPTAGVSAGAVAYGVVIRAVQMSEADPEVTRATAAIVKSLSSDDPNMKQVGEIKKLAVSGQSAASAQLETNSPIAAGGNTQPERDWLVVVPRGQGHAIFMVFVSPLADFDRLRPTFEKMLRSVKF